MSRIFDSPARFRNSRIAYSQLPTFKILVWASSLRRLSAAVAVGEVRHGHELGAQDSAHDHSVGGNTHWCDHGVAGGLGLYYS